MLAIRSQDEGRTPMKPGVFSSSVWEATMHLTNLLVSKGANKIYIVKNIML